VTCLSGYRYIHADDYPAYNPLRALPPSVRNGPLVVHAPLNHGLT
jgi:hypothetical protein